jgi:CelD/BcsL family acetyltransferase involved in cellulose biosynthesis
VKKLKAAEGEGITVSGVRLVGFASIGAALPIWRALEIKSPSAYYQTADWCEAWLSTMGRAAQVTPFILVGTAISGEGQFLLPFQVLRRFGLITLEWMCQPESNYTHGLFAGAPPQSTWAEWFSQNITQVLGALPPYDVAALRDMPSTLFDQPSPLAALHRFASANQSFKTCLETSYTDLLQKKRSPRSISKIRRRDERLAESGPLSLEILSGGPQAAAAVTEMLQFKTQQLAEVGVTDFSSPELRNFISTLLEAPEKSLRLFRLQQSGKTISALLGASHAKTFWLLVLTMSPDAPMHLSPGDYILRQSIAWACTQGLNTYDFSTGQSHYKELWADDEIQLYDYFAAKSWKGLPVAAGYLAFYALKRCAKNTPWLKNAIFKLRQLVRGKTALRT